jgi:two-component system sensor histidine kinase KdpD
MSAAAVLQHTTSPQPPAWVGYTVACLSTAAVTVVIGQVLAHAPVTHLSMLYLAPVLSLAVFFGRGPAVLGSVLAFLTYNWFFTEPLHTLTIYNPDEWLALVLFLLVAIVCGELAARVRQRAQEAEQREREALWLYQLAALLAAPDSLHNRLNAAADWLVNHFDLAAALLNAAGPSARQEIMGQAGQPDACSYLVQAASSGIDGQQVLRGRADAPGALPRFYWVRVRRGLRGQAALPLPWDVRSIALMSAGGQVGALYLARPAGAPPLTRQQDQLIAAGASQIALAVQQARLQAAATEADALRRADELKTALLDSVSHDLRTPLASIKASAGSLRQKEVVWSDADRDAFAAAIEQEADRLDRLVGHLLDLSRIESGALTADRQWHDLTALVQDVVARLRPVLAGHPVALSVPDDLPPVPLDYVQISEVLTNLLENAARHTPDGTPIAVRAWQDGDCVVVEVADAGPGIPARALPHVFDKFFGAGDAPGRRRRGSGLGLAVARGMVEAHGGHIWAESAPGAGTRFWFTLPLDRPVAVTAQESA